MDKKSFPGNAACSKPILRAVKIELKKEGRTIIWLTETLFLDWLKGRGVFLSK